MEREKRLIEKEGEELRSREKEVAERWMLNEESKEEPSAGSADRWMLNQQSKEEASAGSASRSRLRIRAILEKQARQRVSMNVFLTFRHIFDI